MPELHEYADGVVGSDPIGRMVDAVVAPHAHTGGMGMRQMIRIGANGMVMAPMHRALRAVAEAAEALPRTPMPTKPEVPAGLNSVGAARAAQERGGDRRERRALSTLEAMKATALDVSDPGKLPEHDLRWLLKVAGEVTPGDLEILQPMINAVRDHHQIREAEHDVAMAEWRATLSEHGAKPWGNDDPLRHVLGPAAAWIAATTPGLTPAEADSRTAAWINARRDQTKAKLDANLAAARARLDALRAGTRA